jgi:hypothetical protein
MKRIPHNFLSVNHEMRMLLLPATCEKTRYQRVTGWCAEFMEEMFGRARGRRLRDETRSRLGMVDTQ